METISKMHRCQHGWQWGAVAEWVERRSLNPEVLGSIPPTPFRILGNFVYPTLP